MTDSRTSEDRAVFKGEFAELAGGYGQKRPHSRGCTRLYGRENKKIIGIISLTMRVEVFASQ
jgi:hypothetical protein